MTDFAVDVPSLGQAAARAEAVATDLRGELEVLRSDVAGVLDGGWRGRAADVFDRAWLDWFTAAVETVDALDDLAHGVAMCAADYRASDIDAGAALALAAR